MRVEAEVGKPGDYRVTYVGTMPVIVARDVDDEIYAFENRCAHRGALIALDGGGSARDFTCVYHAWNYDLKGNLKAVAFEDGVNGKGGMGKTFCRSDHGPRKLRIAVFAGLVFGSLSDDVPPIEEYLGEEIATRIKRVMCKPVVVLGRFTQSLNNNWKLYFENVKDTYHASLLHTFFTTFRINRLSQRGGMVVSPSGGNHASFSFADQKNSTENDYSAMGLRSEIEDFALKDTRLLDNVDVTQAKAVAERIRIEISNPDDTVVYPLLTALLRHEDVSDARYYWYYDCYQRYYYWYGWYFDFHPRYCGSGGVFQ